METTTPNRWTPPIMAIHWLSLVLVAGLAGAGIADGRTPWSVGTLGRNGRWSAW